MKENKRTIIGLILLMAILAIGNLTVHADERKYEIEKLKLGHSLVKNTEKRDRDITTLYYFSVPAPGKLSFTFSNKGNYYISVYKKVGTKYYSTDSEGTIFEKKTVDFALDKGKYYFMFGDWTNREEDLIKIQVKYKRAINKANYMPSRAIKLKKNKNVEVIQTPHYHYKRWYKIQVPKKQAVTLTIDGIDGIYGNISFLNDAFVEVGLERAGAGSKRYFTQTKIPKGTYYISIEDSSGIINFKWK